MWPEEESHISIVQVPRVVEKDVKEEGITSMEKKTEKNAHLQYCTIILTDKVKC